MSFTIPLNRKILTEKKITYKRGQRKLCVLNFLDEKYLIRLINFPKPIVENYIMNDNYQSGFKITWEELYFIIEEEFDTNKKSLFKKWLNDSYNDKTVKAKNICFNKDIYFEDYGGDFYCSKFELIGCVASGVSFQNGFPKVSLSFNNLYVPEYNHVG